MKKWLITILSLSLLTGTGYYLYNKQEAKDQITQDEKGYEYVEKVLDNVEPEKILWIDSTLYIKAEDIVYTYSEQGELAQEFLQVNQNSTIGVKDNQLIICSWENRLIMSEDEFATEISIMSSSGEELHSASFHETLKIDACSEDTISLSNAYPILQEIQRTLDWEGKSIELEKEEPEISLGGEDNIMIYKGAQSLVEIPLINTVETYAVSPYQEQIAFYTYTNQVWVINLSK